VLPNTGTSSVFWTSVSLFAHHVTEWKCYSLWGKPKIYVVHIFVIPPVFTQLSLTQICNWDFLQKEKGIGIVKYQPDHLIQATLIHFMGFPSAIVDYSCCTRNIGFQSISSNNLAPRDPWSQKVQKSIHRKTLHLCSNRRAPDACLQWQIIRIGQESIEPRWTAKHTNQIPAQKFPT
jgi:hypothetical protein